MLLGSPTTLPSYNFDASGNLSFGITDYTDFPGQKYDPDIGIFGMDVNVVWKGPGIGFPEGESSPEEYQLATESGPMNLDMVFKSYNLKIVGYEEEE